MDPPVAAAMERHIPCLQHTKERRLPSSASKVPEGQNWGVPVEHAPVSFNKKLLSLRRPNGLHASSRDPPAVAKIPHMIAQMTVMPGEQHPGHHSTSNTKSKPRGMPCATELPCIFEPVPNPHLPLRSTGNPWVATKGCCSSACCGLRRTRKRLALTRASSQTFQNAPPEEE
jgi:hypothetical protein|eukprot:CAMPEP_0174314980 /NCGR_PEP_ID=MMETSP0810-20121108/5983_1 /TAXON_ID=73025 ORGANISM="Eutreptiella gymnastica-like, Strain CCMP1594" /NCGR_SAMPLE_ID=MMETSP0810 /ASSEMBLY_ACC=CAM_ASM_000659 /LENGTH=171 /DNA_ID=CAMNT_0015424217 /DNA_START=121 /DNA_END=636 /DNA_ORIENTATION=-